MDGHRRRTTLVRRGLFFTLACGIVAALLPLTRVQPTHGAPGMLLVGDQNIEANVDSNAAGTAEAMQFTALASGSAGMLVVYLDAGSSATSVKIGLYANSGNNAGALLTQGTIASPVAGSWNSVLVPAASVTAGTKYWIAVLGTGGVVKFRDVVTGGPAQVSSSTSLSSLPASWSPGVNYSSAPISAYASTVDTSPPVISNVSVGNIGDLGVTITWTTDEPSTSVVQFGTTPGFGSQATDSPLVVSHSLGISGLQASTLYYARVTSADPSGNSAFVDITFTTAAAGATASTQGEWAPVMQWPFVAVHGAMLPSGQMTFWDAWETPPLTTHLWDTNVQTWDGATIGSAVFCGAQLLLADGRLMTIGGHNGGAVGIKDTELLNAATSTWTRGADMKFPRWYPSMTMLSDGRVVAISGNTTPGNWANTPEVYNPTTNAWTNVPVSTSTLREEQYPFSFALPNGKVFVIGEMSSINGVLDVNAGTWQTGVAGPNPFANGTAAMYRPGKILYTGGTDAAETVSFTNAATVDMTAASPHWTNIAPMSVGRYLHNLVDLPDGTVLAVGGSAQGGNQTTTSGSMPAEIWNPDTGGWTTMASLTDPRQYHSIAMLLPDGRILMAGGGRWDVYPDFYTAQVYSPPYLFKGARPTISAAPTATTYGSTITVSSPDAGSIASAALIKLPANTHAEDFAQTYVPLPFTAGSGSLDLQMPASGTIASPGYYMLFIVNGAGVPSVAKIIQVTSGGGPPPTATPTGTATATATRTATATSTSTPTATSVPGTPAATNTSTNTATATNSATVTNTATITSTPTMTPTGGATTTFGITTSAGTNDNSDAGFINGSPFALNTAGTLSSLSVYVGSTPANAHLRLALYSNNASGNPGTLIAQSSEATATTGWNTLPIAGGPSLASGTYWIVAQTDNNATVYRLASGLAVTNFEGWAAQAYGTFPAATSGWTKVAKTSFDMYGTVTLGGVPTSTATQTASATRTTTATNTMTPTRTSTPTATVTLTATSTTVPTATLTPSPTSTSTAPATSNNTATATDTPLPTATDTPPATATATDMPTTTATATATSSATASATNSPTATATSTAVPTATNTLTATATSTATATATNSATATATNTAVPTATDTPTASATNTATATATNSATATATNTAVPTATNTPTATATSSPLPTATGTPTATATNTPTGTPVTFGLTTPAGTNDNSDYGYANGSRFALSAPGTLVSLSVYVGSTPANAHIRMAIYSNNASGNPGTLIAQTSAVVATAGWNTLAVPGNVALATGTYWIVAQTDNTGTVYRIASGLSTTNYVGWGALAYGTFPATLGGWSKTSRQSFDMYGTVAP